MLTQVAIMKKGSEDEPKIGDFIVTNNLFSVNGDKQRQILSGLPGIIVHKENGRFGVRFGKGHSWTSNIHNMLSGPWGYILDKQQFDLDNE